MKKFLVALLLAGCSHVVLAAPPTFDEAYKVLSEKVQKNDFAAALKEADNTLDLAQTSEQKAKVRLRIADIKYIQHDFIAAREQYERILELPKLNPSAKSNALTLIETTYLTQQPRDYGKARATSQRIIDGEEFSAHDKSTARLQIATTYALSGDRATARQHWQDIAQDKSVEIWARVEALQSLAVTDRKQKNYAAARENYQRAASLAPNDMNVKVFALDGIAQSYYEEKNFSQARQKFAEILDLDIQKSPEFYRYLLEVLQGQAQFNIAKTYASEGDKTRARAEFAKISAMPGGNFHSAQVKDALEQLDSKPELAK